MRCTAQYACLRGARISGEGSGQSRLLGWWLPILITATCYEPSSIGRPFRRHWVVGCVACGMTAHTLDRPSTMVDLVELPNHSRARVYPLLAAGRGTQRQWPLIWLEQGPCLGSHPMSNSHVPIPHDARHLQHVTALFPKLQSFKCIASDGGD